MGSPARVHGPFEYYDVTGDAVRGAADAPGAKAGEVDDISNQLDGDEKKMVDATEGDIAAGVEKNPKAAKNSAKHLAGNGQWACACLREFAGDIDTFDGTTAGLNERYNSAVFSAQHDQSVRSGDKSLSEVKKNLEAAIRDPEYTNAEEALETAAEKVAGKLEDPPSPDDVIAMIRAGFMPLTAASAFPKVKLSADDKRAAFKALMGNKTPEEQAKWAIEHPELAKAYLPGIPTAVREFIGQEIADQGKYIKDDENDVSKDDLKDFGALVDAFGKDSVVATSFLNKIGPKGLLELNGRIALSMKDNSESDYPVDKDMASTLGKLQTGLGEMLAAGTRNVLPETRYRGPDSGGADHVSEDWINRLTQAGRDKIEIGGLNTGQPNGWEVYGYQLLAPMLGSESHSSHFLNDVGTDMLYFEQQYAEDNDGRLPWNEVWTDGGSAVGGHDQTSGVNTGMRLDWTDGYGHKDTAGWDPMTGLMEGMKNNPQAARDFFTDGTVYSDGEEPELTRLNYLLHDRDWPDDDVHQMGDRDDEITGVNSLGQALRSATVVDPDQDSVDIVEALVHSTYEHMPHGEDAGRFSEENMLPPEVRDEFSDIMGHYMPSVYTAMGQNPHEAVDTSDGSVFNDARFNDDGQGELPTMLMLGELSKDAEGREILTGYANAQAMVQLNDDMQGVDSSTGVWAGLKETSGTSAEVLGAIDFGATSSKAEDQLADDESYNQNVDDAVSAATGLLGDTPIGKVPGAGTVMDLVGSKIAEAQHVDHRGQLNHELGLIFQDGSDTHSSIVRDAVWRNVPSDEYPPGMDGSEDLENLAPQDQRAYDEWLQNNPWGQAVTGNAQEAEQGYGTGVAEAKRALEPYGR